MPFVYMLRCWDDSLYVGYTEDVTRENKRTMKVAVAHIQRGAVPYDWSTLSAARLRVPLGSASVS